MAHHHPAAVSTRAARRVLVLVSAVAVIVLAACAPAWAGEPEGRSSADEPPKTAVSWYGWQTLIADGVSLLVVPTVGSAMNDGGGSGGGVVLAAAGSYLFLPGVIHLAHGRPGPAAASVGLRASMPIVVGLLGAGLGSTGHNGENQLGFAIVGFLLGMASASALDAALLSRERVQEEPTGRQADVAAAKAHAKASAKASAKAITFTPLGGPRREGGFDLGVGAIF